MRKADWQIKLNLRFLGVAWAFCRKEAVPGSVSRRELGLLVRPWSRTTVYRLISSVESLPSTPPAPDEVWSDPPCSALSWDRRRRPPGCFSAGWRQARRGPGRAAAARAEGRGRGQRHGRGGRRDPPRRYAGRGRHRRHPRLAQKPPPPGPAGPCPAAQAQCGGGGGRIAGCREGGVDAGGGGASRRARRGGGPVGGARPAKEVPH